MNKQRGSDTVAGLLALVFVITLIVSWVVNLFKLIDCDFEPTYKEEVIHGIGLVPIISLFTVWYDKPTETKA